MGGGFSRNVVGGFWLRKSAHPPLPQQVAKCLSGPSQCGLTPPAPSSSRLRTTFPALVDVGLTQHRLASDLPANHGPPSSHHRPVVQSYSTVWSVDGSAVHVPRNHPRNCHHLKARPGRFAIPLPSTHQQIIKRALVLRPPLPLQAQGGGGSGTPHKSLQRFTRGVLKTF